jgi:hypothetical protein
MASKRKRKRTYEGSKADIAEDKRGAEQLGVSLKEYEATAQDKAEDRRGETKMGRKK